MAGSVIVAEMDPEQCSETAKVLRQAGEFEIAGLTDNGEDALDMVLRFHPDILILGMQMPRMDGAELLQQLKLLPAERRPISIVVSNVRKDDYIRRAFELGAEDYLVKPYDAHALVRRIEELQKQHCEEGRGMQQLEQRLSGMLLRLGVPAHVKGYRFLYQAVLETLVDPALMHAMIHGLYPKIASKYQTTAGCVERSIRSAIGLAWERCKPEETSRILGRSVNANYEKPTSGELIALVAERMRQYM